MFDFFKKKSVCADMELYQKIQTDGLEYTAAKLAFSLIQKDLRDYEMAYLFVLQELDGASYGDEKSRDFVKNSGIDYSEYGGAMINDMPDEVERASLFLIKLSMGLQPLQDLIANLRLLILNEIMIFYKIGKYKSRTLDKDGLLDNIEPLSILNIVEIVQPWSFSSIFDNLNKITEKLPKNYNALMPILYATRFTYAGLYNQGRIGWDLYNSVYKDHFMPVMINIGNRISRTEQVYFQEKSNDLALEFLKECDPLINKSVVTAMVLSAKNKFSLQEAIGEDLIVTSYLSVCYYARFGYSGTENTSSVRDNFIKMLKVI
ncbi:hypothetical protein SAMN02745664_10940 [Moraxella cuniculi DSM 21768]|uniref:Uncharacterized protein n=1 Tax=Moraxella cuniculi DSM 21768 TaxID=1122245 RepID=A0A1N7F2N9_9GAMM|nr:hypothetical protein [Moraxella cuniculi]OOS05043.1 hypothetical protein B0189_07705 [Moraxella cuniculi]SIR94475.1 hypothetical protein SAMN02745664_10940 [Moraxella cuniculi DSM 21768]